MNCIKPKKNRISFIITLTGFFLLLFSINVKAECWLEDKITGQHFRIFNGFLYKGMPDLSDLCIEPINVMYAWEFFPRGHKRGDLKMPKPTDLRKAIAKTKEKNQVTVIDIEHWPLKNARDKVLSESVKNYFEVISQFKESLPDQIVGYYGVVPTVDFSRSKSNKKGARYYQWMRENDRAIPIANVVDALFPSLYTINPNKKSWVGRAKAHISESNRLAPGKPVYPFIWPNYHEQGGRYPSGTEVESDYWKLQLEYLRDNADGIVLWGGNKQTWNKNMQWWKELVTFIQASFVIRED